MPRSGIVSTFMNHIIYLVQTVYAGSALRFCFFAYRMNIGDTQARANTKHFRLSAMLPEMTNDDHYQYWRQRGSLDANRKAGKLHDFKLFRFVTFN